MTPTRKDWALTPQERSDARAAVKILEGTGISLEEAARRAVAGRRAIHRVTCNDAVDTFLRALLARRARPGTYNWYSDRLSIFLRTFGERFIDDVPRTDLIQWLAGVTPMDAGRRHYAKAVRAFFRWAVSHEPPLTGADVTVGIVARQQRGEADIKFLSVDQCAAILAGAGAYRNAIALGLFAGIRPEEIAGKGKPWLQWKHVNAAEKILRIPAEISKTRKGRILEGLPDALWRWISPGKPDESISAGRARQIASAARVLAGYGPGSSLGKWPTDIIRHTFATYAVASLGESGKVINWLGHEGNASMLHRHYRGLATKAQSEGFWGLRPNTEARALQVPGKA